MALLILAGAAVVGALADGPVCTPSAGSTLTLQPCAAVEAEEWVSVGLLRSI